MRQAGPVQRGRSSRGGWAAAAPVGKRRPQHTGSEHSVCQHGVCQHGVCQHMVCVSSLSRKLASPCGRLSMVLRASGSSLLATST